MYLGCRSSCLPPCETESHCCSSLCVPGWLAYELLGIPSTGALGSQMLTATLALSEFWEFEVRFLPCMASALPTEPSPQPKCFILKMNPRWPPPAPLFLWLISASWSCYSKPLWCHILCLSLLVSPGEEMHFFLNAHGSFIVHISWRPLFCPVYYLLFLFPSHIINPAWLVLSHSPVFLRPYVTVPCVSGWLGFFGSLPCQLDMQLEKVS